jgi:hypothetical protein
VGTNLMKWAFLSEEPTQDVGSKIVNKKLVIFCYCFCFILFVVQF